MLDVAVSANCGFVESVFLGGLKRKCCRDGNNEKTMTRFLRKSTSSKKTVKVENEVLRPQHRRHGVQ